MRKFVYTTVFVIAYLFICFCAPVALSEEPLKKHAILSLTIADQFVGSDCPIFALYDNGTAIFRSMKAPFEYNEHLYQSVKLSQTEKEAILNLVSKLADVKNDYSIDKASDQAWNIFLINTPTLKKRISVYGDLTDSYPPNYSPRDEVPLSLVHLFDKLSDFENNNAKPWLPEYIEVQLSPWDDAKEPPLAWPANWPGLTDKRTKWSRVENGYSIYLPSDNLHQLISLLKQNRPILLANRKWVMIYRFPFPDEQ